MPNEATDVLAALYPALLRFAEKQLRSRYLPTHLAEDLVQEAAASWFATGLTLRTTAEFTTWMRSRIRDRACDAQRAQIQHGNVISIEVLKLAHEQYLNACDQRSESK